MMGADMRTLIDYELKKLTSQKIFFLLVALLLVLNGIFMNREILKKARQTVRYIYILTVLIYPFMKVR